MKMLSLYLLFSVLYLVFLNTTKSQPCPDAANWNRLAELLPNWNECGHYTKNLQSTVSSNNYSLRYANLGRFPSLVLIRTEMNLTDKYGKASWTYQMCNGVLITKQHVLTAAHCLQEPPVPRYNLTDRLIRIIIGEYKTENSGKDCVTTEYNTTCAPPAYAAFVSKVIPHEHFNRFSLHHDIAILELTAPVTFTDFVQPMCIPHSCGLDYTVAYRLNETMTYVGWRIYWTNRNRSYPPNTLQNVEMAVVEPWYDNYYCDKVYLWLDNNTQLCTHLDPPDLEDQINCDAYTGGPLVLEDLQHIVLGIASYGETCNRGRVLLTGDPVVMTWVPAYVRWILRTLYFLKYNKPYPYKFVDIKWSSGIEGD